MWKNICSHIFSLELPVTCSRFGAGESRCDHCGECLMKASGKKPWEWNDVVKRSENIISSFQPSTLLDYVAFQTGHVKLSALKTFALKSPTQARWQDAAPRHCEHEPHAVTFTRMRDDMVAVTQSNVVLAGVFQPAGCPRRPSTITRMMIFIARRARLGLSVGVIPPLPIHQALRTELLTARRNYRLRWCLINHQILITGSAFIPQCWQGDWLMANSSHSVTGFWCWLLYIACT